jgi:hypothetical protein
MGRSVAIDEGLNPGDRIIVNRTNQLNDGSPVRVITEQTIKSEAR